VTTLYVDSLIILASNATKLKWLKSELEKEFEMSDLGELHDCLGVKFGRNRKAHTITMNQRRYIEEVLERLNMDECKLVGNPFNADSKLYVKNFG
jgi:hypothetical protein